MELKIPLNLIRPWDNNQHHIWLASTISIQRNLEKFNFPGKLDKERLRQIVPLVANPLLSSSLLNNPTLIQAAEIGPLEKEFLLEHFLTKQDLHQTQIGEAFVIDSSGEFLAAINIRNHILIQIIDCQEELEASWERLIKIETELEKRISFSFSPRFGFLTADPFQAGTALSVAIFLQLPALIHTDKANDVLEKYQDDYVTITGIQGNPTEVIGDVLVLQNSYTLGVNEESIISSLRLLSTKLQVEEKAARNLLSKEESAEMKDRVSRAFGILIHSYQIEAIEALNAISLLKLGIDLNWLTGVSIKQLNQLFFTCRRAHLLCQMETNIKQEEIPHKRAEFIHQTLKEAKLLI